MKIRSLLIRAAWLLTATASLAILTGCACDSHQETAKTSTSAKTDPKEMKTMTSGPHQGN